MLPKKGKGSQHQKLLCTGLSVSKEISKCTVDLRGQVDFHDKGGFIIIFISRELKNRPRIFFAQYEKTKLPLN